MYSDVLSLLTTLSDVDLLLSEVGEAQKGLFLIHEGSLHAALTKHARAESAKVLLTLYAKSGKEPGVFLEELSSYITQLPLMQLTLAFSPSQEFMMRLSTWGRSQVNPSLIFDINVEPHIIGGTIITYNGKYADYSLAKRFASQSDTIAAIVASHLGDSV